MCGHLFLSTVIAMFSQPWNIPSLADFVRATMEVLIHHSASDHTLTHPPPSHPPPSLPPSLPPPSPTHTPYST